MPQTNTSQADNKGCSRTDPELSRKLASIANGETLKYCYQCGTCTSVCPISKFIGIYRPNKIMELCKLGIRDMPQSNAFLFCCACTLCTKGCPQGVKVHKIMQTMKELAVDDKNVEDFIAEHFDSTIQALGHAMPLPLIYSWICLRPPEKEGGTASAYDEAIKKALDRAMSRPVADAAVNTQPNAANNTSQSRHSALDAESPATAKKVAVIGSGPAGLTAAWALAKAGLTVTVFESLPKAGGMLRTGIPGYRLPKDVLDFEIDNIKALGVEIRTNSAVDAVLFEKLVNDGQYAAVFVATGSYKSRRLGLANENLNGVTTAVDFLKEYNLNGKAKVGKNVVVIGGGNVATDAAGAAVRSGASSVRLFCLEDRKTMPAHEWEIDDAIADGVEINPSWGPLELMSDGENGADGNGAEGKNVTGVKFIRCKSVLDKNGRFNPVFNDKETQEVEADTVISAIGQGPDLSFLSQDVKIRTMRGAIQADPYTMETNIPNVFAAGDAVSGTASLIEAITGGKTAALSVLRYLALDCAGKE